MSRPKMLLVPHRFDFVSSRWKSFGAEQELRVERVRRRSTCRGWCAPPWGKKTNFSVLTGETGSPSFSSQVQAKPVAEAVNRGYDMFETTEVAWHFHFLTCTVHKPVPTTFSRIHLLKTSHCYDCKDWQKETHHRIRMIMRALQLHHQNEKYKNVR